MRTPVRGLDSNQDALNEDVSKGEQQCEEDTAPQLSSISQELSAVKLELEACQKKLKEKVMMDLVRLTVRCHKSVLRREEEHEKREDLEKQVREAKEASQQELCDLQKQLVEKTDLLLASEKKFAQLLAWAQKNKAAHT